MGKTAAGVRSSFMVQAIKAGQSANQTLASLRANGLGMRRQDFLTAFAEIVGALAARADVARADLESFPTAAHIRPWSASTSARYSYQIEAQVREAGTGFVYTDHFGVNSETLITFGEALESAMDLSTAIGETYGFTVIAGVVTGVYEGTV